MPTHKDVREVIQLCQSLGLVVDPIGAGGHRKVRDPRSNAYLFGISSSPSDPNWRWMIMRHLRRLGLLKDGRKKQKGHRRKSAVDLQALARAQAQAESRGERIPLLDDLDDKTFFSKIRRSRTEPLEYSEEAIGEVIDLMAPRADAPRIVATRQRLKNLLVNKNAELLEQRDTRLLAEGKRRGNPNKGARAEFVRTAMFDVAPKRNLRVWKSVASGEQTLTSFLENNSNITVWVADLIDATMDHIDGLKFGVIDESRKRVVTPPPESQFVISIASGEVDEEGEVTKEPDVAVIGPIKVPELTMEEQEFTPVTAGEETAKIESTDHIRERYADTLLEILNAEGSKTDDRILERLDKLAGI